MTSSPKRATASSRSASPACTPALSSHGAQIRSVTPASARRWRVSSATLYGMNLYSKAPVRS